MEHMMNRGKVVDNRSKCFAVPIALVLCLGTLPVPKARAQVSPHATANSPIVSVNFVTTAATPLNPGFNGFSQSLNNAVEYYDTNFQHMLTTLSPGWLLFPAGTESEAFDWASGKIVPAWVDALAAKAYTHDLNAGALPIVAGKGGSSFKDFAALSANAGGAKIIVRVNAYTDTPQSAQAFAQYALTNHIPVAVWELANEPYTWLKTAGEPGAFFTDATDYANKMKPYRDAIKAADPNAVVSLYFSEAGHPDKAWDNALASYSPKYWDVVTYHEYVFPGNLTTFDDLMAAANGSLFSNTTSYVTDYLMPKNNPGMTYVISEVSPSGGQGGLLLGTLYGGIYSAEFALRVSTLPQVKHVASFQMLSNAGIDETNRNLKVVEAAYASGTTINTSGLNFGFFLSAQAAAEAVANGALHNSIGVYATTTTGGPAAPTDGGGSIPAVYGQAYESGNGKRYVVLTNKGASTATARIMQDGAELTNPMQMTFVTGTDPSLVNTGMVPDNVQIQTRTITSPGAVTIPPYSVERLEWSVLQSATLQLSADGTTVYDTVNNITWLADVNLAASRQFGLPLCNGSGSGTKTCVNATGSMSYESATAWVAAMNAANYLGHNNWQLPTTPLVDKTCPKTGPNGGSFGFGCTAGALDTIYNEVGLKAPNTAVPIPNNTVGPFSNFQPYLYWSQTSAGPTQGNATFSFATGFQGANTLPNFLYLLPMIQGKIPGTPPATGNGLQVNPGGQTVYDPITNITWVANANLAASNTFGLPACKDPTTPATCVNQDGAMTWDSAVQFIANMNSAAYLGQTHWQAPAVDPACTNFNCGGARNPMGNLFYTQLGVGQGMTVVTPPNILIGLFHNIQPYLYWTCQASTIQGPCEANGPAPNFEWSYSFGSGFQGTDLLANNLYVTAYFVGRSNSINAGGIVNNASYASSGVVPGEIVAIFGTNLTDGSSCLPPSCNPTFGSNGKLNTTMAGAQVTVDQTPVPIFYATPGQLGVQIPFELTGTSATVVVSVRGQASAPASINLGTVSPGIFTATADGKGAGAITHVNGSAVSAQNPARPAELVIFYATGLGQVAPAVPTGALPVGISSTVAQVTLSIGGITVVPEFAGLAGCCVGLNQINARIPVGVTRSDAVPVILNIGGKSSNMATIAVQ